MDGLSLLCNLHADGALALRRLRAAGVRDLRDLEGLPQSSLSACLRSSAGQARRFVEEARQLALRLAESALEPEPAQPGPSAEQPQPFAWRAEVRAPAANPAGAQQLLEPGLFVGLDERTSERLAAQGVRTVEALHERASLALARSAGMPFTKLLDLVAQARLALPQAIALPLQAPDLPPRSARLRSHEVVPEAPRHAPAPTGRSVAAALSAVRSSGARRVPASDPGSAGPFG